MKFLAQTLSLLLCFTCFTSHAQDLTLRGTLTRANHQTYVELPFTVPANITRISVDFSYTGRELHTTIDLGLFDSERFRGWSGGNKHAFTVSESDATPSYLPGPIRPGIWKLILGVPNLREGVTSTYEAHIHLSRASDTPTGSAFSAAPLRTGPAWYRGDLHMPDAHSDGSCQSQAGQKVPCPLYKTVEAATARGLDFIAISDHNTTSHFDAMQELQPYFDRLLLIPAREITTFDGHANVFGPTAFIDFRLTSPTVPDLNHLLDQVESLHGLISINHPSQPTGEACMGCGWSVPNTDYRRIPAIEAVNGSNAETRISGIPFWQARLNEGLRITAIGGSDNHNAEAPPASNVGHPTTVVYAKELSETAILNAIRAGHVFIDTEGTKDRAIEFSAKSKAATAIMGDSLDAPSGQPIHFTLRLLHLEGAHPEIIEDGQPTGLLPTTALSGTDSTQSFDIPSDGRRHWLRVNIRSNTGILLLVGNPIFLNLLAQR
ncbi:CehA/McbA family metallohydrolase [soil metagenome]